ncbi:MAG: PAS domain S-box protein [Phycisphaerales bacterium]|nr:PAS domain S-box protein [Phycisphaerales bacterium]
MTEGGSFFRSRGRQDADHVMNDVRLAEAVYHCLLDAMIVMDQEGFVQEFNPRAEEMFGYSRSEALGQELAALIVPEEMREAHRQGLSHYLKSGEGPVLGKRIEIEGVHKDGNRIPIELAISARTFGDEHVFVATLRDLTNEKAKQAELDQVRRYLDNIMEYGPTIFYVVRISSSGDGKVSWISPNLIEILDVDAEGLIRGTIKWQDRVHPADLPDVLERWQACWSEGFNQLEYRIYDQSGQLRWVRESRRVVGADESEIIGSIEDITESRKSERRERVLQMELDHRVKNNLQVILGECEKVVLSGDLDRARIASLATRIRSMAIVHQALADGSWSPIEMSELIKKCEMALIQSERKGTLECKGPAVKITVDAGMTLGAVFNELIHNSMINGALSVQDGLVEVKWWLEGEDESTCLVIEWMERVPSGNICPPEHKGFGFSVLESMIPYELAGEVALDFRSEGLVFNARIPLDQCRRDMGRVRGQIRDGHGRK